MSVADDIFLGQLCWADLTADEKCNAVYSQLVEGRTVAEAAAQLSVTYGAVSQNAVRGVMDRHGLDKNQSVRLARLAREQLERAACLARTRALKPEKPSGAPGGGDKLPAIDPPRLGNVRKKARITIWDLKPWQCRTPLWDKDETDIAQQFYCGQRKAPGSNWCADCAKIVYRPPEERPQRHNTSRDSFPKRGRYRRWK